MVRPLSSVKEVMYLVEFLLKIISFLVEIGLNVFGLANQNIADWEAIILCPVTVFDYAVFYVSAQVISVSRFEFLAHVRH